MSTAIQPYNPNSIDDIQRTAKLLAASGYFDSRGSGDVQIAQLATKIMAGAEMGYAPFTAVQGIHVIQGKPTIGANLMAAAVKAHPCYDYRVKRLDNDGVEIEFFQVCDGRRESLGVESFTMDDAKAAGLTGKDNWRKFPRNMLFARCISNGVRFRCPDVFNGNSVYVPEELGADVDGDGNITAQYTVSKPTPQNGNGVTPDDMIDVDMADVEEDTAGHLATPHEQPEAEADEGEFTVEPWRDWTEPGNAYEWALSHGIPEEQAKAEYAQLVTTVGKGKHNEKTMPKIFEAFFIRMGQLVPA